MVAGPDNDSSEGPGRGRPHQMTRELIVEEAAKIPHEEFSLARLADALGTSPQSLYHYFPNKESIFTAIAQEIADSVPMVDPDLHFPLPHAGRSDCIACHRAPAGPAAGFVCTDCHAHAADVLDAAHEGIPQFGLDREDCLYCHPTGLAN